MKKLALATVALCAISFVAFADDVVMPSLIPVRPAIAAQGGSSVATAKGYDALFSNPAGFASAKGSLTIVSANPWMYGNPSDLLIAAGVATNPDGRPTFDEDSGADFLAREAENGVGFGVSAGVGYVGRGLGLAVVNTAEFFLSGTPFPGGVSGYVANEFSLIGGLALTPINGKKIKLSVGADLRPSIRMYAPIDGATAVDVLSAMSSGSSDIYTALNAAEMYQGAGLGIDLGSKLTLGDFTVALAFRDLFGTRYAMSGYPLGDWAEAYGSSGTSPDSGTEVSDTYIVPMNIVFGGAWHLDFGGLSFLIDPTIHAELSDPIGVIRDGQSPWALLHAGAEVKVLRFISLWSGLNQGYLTAGAGAKLLFLDLNVAAFTNELGRYAGDNPSSGVTAEVALRF